MKKIKIVLIDEGTPGQIISIENVNNLSDHTKKMYEFFCFNYLRLGGIIDNVEIISVSYFDCIRDGYDKIRNNLIEQYEYIDIELHAYSIIYGANLKPTIKSFNRSRTNKSIIICSCGHDLNRVRFPAAEPGVISVGVYDNDDSIRGVSALNQFSPSLLIANRALPYEDLQGNKCQIRGSSPAVIYSACLYSRLLELNGEEKLDPTAVYTQLLSNLEPYSNGFIINYDANALENTRITKYGEGRNSKANISLSVVTNQNKDAYITIIPEHCEANYLWFAKPIKINIGIKEINNIYEDVARVKFNKDLNTNTFDITIQIDGLFSCINLASSNCTLIINEGMTNPKKNKTDSLILGISASHDSSACLLLNDKIICGVQLERITGIKRDGLPYLNSNKAIQYCLDAAGFRHDDIDHFGYNIQSITPEYVGLSQPVASSNFSSFDPFSENSIFVSHHLCHAFSAYSGSNYNCSQVFVADGSGGTSINSDDLLLNGPQFFDYLESGLDSTRPSLHVFSVYYFDKHSFKLLHREQANSFNVRSGSSSLGETYASVSNYVFKSWQASGKLMGLAPYGQPIHNFTKYDGDKDIINFDHKWKINYNIVDTQPAIDYKDLAASIQSGLEECLIFRFKKYIDYKIRNIVYTGGIALNSVANRKIRKSLNLDNFYLFPAQSDAGISIGAAAAARFHLTGQISSGLYTDDYLGYIYSLKDVIYGYNMYERFLSIKEINSSQIAERIAKGEIFGYFSLQKGSEFGPRALGARSILADPRSRKTWDFINRWVKFREDFRPFAPMVTRESLNKFFIADEDLPYMLEVVNVREQYKDQLQAVTHVDGTARVQTITRKQHEQIYELLLEFEKITSYPILLNTSFNVRGMPIIENPTQALEMLLSTHLSGVIFDDYIVEIKTNNTPINKHDVIALSPETTLEISKNSVTKELFLNVKNQGKKIYIDNKLESLFLRMDGVSSLHDLTPEISSCSLNIIDKYCKLKYLNKVIS